jgi:nucleoside-diphosphate-sugar epimerase
MAIGKKERVLITGATGFVGANLVRRLVSRGANVHIIVRDGSDLWRIRSMLPCVTVHRANLTDARAIMSVVQNALPYVVYHAAAHGLFLKQKEADQMIVSNILGTVNLFEALRHVGSANCIVNIGSIAEYDPNEPRVQEHSLLQPANVYGVSKASQSLFAQYYARYQKMPIVIVRPSLLYGPYEESRRLVPASVLAHLRKTPLSLASPHSRKDFLFVEDALDAFERVPMCNIAPGEIINIGAGKEYSIQDVVLAVQKTISVRVPLQWGALEERWWDSTQKHVYDVSNAKKLLDWEASCVLEEGLSRTIKWFQKNHIYYPYRS